MFRTECLFTFSAFHAAIIVLAMHVTRIHCMQPDQTMSQWTVPEVLEWADRIHLCPETVEIITKKQIAGKDAGQISPCSAHDARSSAHMQRHSLDHHLYLLLSEQFTCSSGCRRMHGAFSNLLIRAHTCLQLLRCQPLRTHNQSIMHCNHHACIVVLDRSAMTALGIPPLDQSRILGNIQLMTQSTVSPTTPHVFTPTPLHIFALFMCMSEFYPSVFK